MKREKFQAKARQESQTPLRGPAPEFVRAIKEARQSILALSRLVASDHSNSPDRIAVQKNLAIAMRANQILTAFYKGRPLSSVESGDIRNTTFINTVDVAERFMTSGIAENHHVKAFHKWYRDNLIQMGYGDNMISARKFFFIDYQ